MNMSVWCLWLGNRTQGFVVKLLKLPKAVADIIPHIKRNFKDQDGQIMCVLHQNFLT